MDDDLVLVRRGDLRNLWLNAEDSYAMPAGDVYHRLERALHAPAAVRGYRTLGRTLWAVLWALRGRSRRI